MMLCACADYSQAVLPRGSCPECQTTGPLPQPRTATTAEGNNLVPGNARNSPALSYSLTSRFFRLTLFQQPQAITFKTPVNECSGDVAPSIEATPAVRSRQD